MSGLTDARGREVTVCGTHATPVRSTKATHDRFLPDHPWSCERCVELTGGPSASVAPPAAVAEIEAYLRARFGGPQIA